jgi:hypothetical protein
MANYNSLKNAGMLKPVANTDLGSPTNTYGNLYMSGNISLNGTSLNSTNAIAPRIASIAYVGNDTAANPAGGQTITLIGSGFVAGAAVYVGGTIATSVSVVSSTQITFTAPAKTAGNYSFNLVNTDGATATFISGMQYSGVPTWSTSAGSLGSVFASSSVNFTVAATSDSTVSYSVTSGSLPSGVSLNSSTGAITGTAPAVGSSTTYNFTIRATDSENQDTDRNFSMAVNPIVSISIDYLVIAGGGAGGAAFGGGGGAGGYLTATGYSVNTGSPITVTVGAGGTPPGDAYTPGSNGTNSVFGSITAYGGGGTGGYYGGSASGGGSGGGAPNGSSAVGKGVYPGSTYISAPRQGYDGGASGYFGGGGGASVAGGGGTGGKKGGDGLSSSISGTETSYSGGGGGGGQQGVWGNGAGGAGGGGGGGFTGSGTAGTTNTGGGGGGSGMTGGGTAGAGGSGIVIIRYSDSNSAASATTGSPTVTVASGYRVYKFTSSGSITF